MMLREGLVDARINNHYSVTSFYGIGGPQTLQQARHAYVLRHSIEFVEEPTGEFVEPTPTEKEEGVKPFPIVKIHIKINDKEVTTPERIVLSRNIGAQRYYGSLDIMKVNNQKVAIIQRLADKNGEKNLENQDWKIIWIEEKNHLTEEKITYKNRGDHPLAVKLIMESNTTPMRIGYHSDLLEMYPSFVYPIFYPWGTFLIGLISLISSIRKK